MNLESIAQLAQLGAAGLVLATVVLFLRFLRGINADRETEREKFLLVITNHLTDSQRVQGELADALRTLAAQCERRMERERIGG